MLHLRRSRLAVISTLLVLVPLLASSTASTVLAAPRQSYFDDPPPTVSYAGAWQHVGSPNAYNGTLSWSNVSGSTATLSFTGSTITRVYSMANNRGPERIWIDNTLWETRSSFAPETRRQVAKTWSVGAGNHTIKVEAFSSNFTDVDAFIADVPVVQTFSVDDPSGSIRYWGSWQHVSGYSDAYDMTLSWSPNTESGFSLTFNGDAITYVYSKAYNRGIAAVTIDGIDKGYIDLYSPTVLRQKSTTFADLGMGIHTINVTVTGQKNGASSDFFVDVDALQPGSPSARWYAYSDHEDNLISGMISDIEVATPNVTAGHSLETGWIRDDPTGRWVEMGWIKYPGQTARHYAYCGNCGIDPWRYWEYPPCCAANEYELWYDNVNHRWGLYINGTWKDFFTTAFSGGTRAIVGGEVTDRRNQIGTSGLLDVGYWRNGGAEYQGWMSTFRLQRDAGYGIDWLGETSNLQNWTY